jgi:hypothetical protein
MARGELRTLAEAAAEASGIVVIFRPREVTAAARAP